MSKKVRKLKQVKGKIRGDMYQPSAMLTLSILLVFIAVCCALSAASNFDAYSIIMTVLFALVGVLLFLLWKNQKIKIISETEFEYSSFLGKKKVYPFSAITGLKRYLGFAKLLLGKDSIPVFNTSVMSPELIGRIDKVMGVKKNG